MNEYFIENVANIAHGIYLDVNIDPILPQKGRWDGSKAIEELEKKIEAAIEATGLDIDTWTELQDLFF